MAAKKKKSEKNTTKLTTTGMTMAPGFTKTKASSFKPLPMKGGKKK
jgi:hypothetical protein